MRQSDALYKAFLDEMQALESFRMAYTGQRPEAGLDREDPDVRRLIEAMAFFAARTRATALRNILATRRRLFRQYFDFLLSPLPAMGMLQAVPSGRFAEPAVLPAGTEVSVFPPAGRPATFRTLWELRILPIRLRGVETMLRGGAGHRVALHFQAAFPRNDEIGTLWLHVNHMNTYLASLHVLAQLRRHLEGAFVCFDERVTEESTGPRCEVRFGAPRDPDGPQSGDAHPLERVRSFFHFPERELYLAVEVPQPRRNWQRFSVVFDLGRGWPGRKLRLHEDLFKLFVVPVRNLHRMMAAPIEADGRHERYPIRSPEPDQRYELHSVLGVYQVTEQGMTALRPGILAGGAGSYEVELDEPEGEERRGQGRQWLLLELPEAFDAPRTIAVDAMWHQPWFSEYAHERLQAALRTRVVAGVDWELIGGIRPHAESALRDDVEALLHMVSLRSKSLLQLGELAFLLQVLGMGAQRRFRPFEELASDLHVSSVPRPREQGGGFKHIYRVRLRPFAAGEEPAVRVALERAHEVLDCWVADAVVEIEASQSEGGEVWRIGPEGAG